MAVNVGDVVKFKSDGPKGELGRLCRDNGISACVHFKSSGCLRVLKDDLEVTSGKAPECDAGCKADC